MSKDGKTPVLSHDSWTAVFTQAVWGGVLPPQSGIRVPLLLNIPKAYVPPLIIGASGIPGVKHPQHIIVAKLLLNTADELAEEMAYYERHNLECEAIEEDGEDDVF